MSQASVSGRSLQSLTVCVGLVIATFFLLGSRHEYISMHAVRAHAHTNTHINLSLFNRGPMFTDITLRPAVLH